MNTIETQIKGYIECIIPLDNEKIYRRRTRKFRTLSEASVVDRTAQINLRNIAGTFFF